MKSDSYYRNGEDLNFVPCTHEEERARFVAAKAGDEAAKERLIHDHLLLVADIARKMCKDKLPEDEVISAANFALMKAYETFDPNFPNRFSGFLKLHVRGEIARLWREQNIVHKGTFSDGETVTSVPLSEETADESTSNDREHDAFMVKLLLESQDVLDDKERQVVGLIYCEGGIIQAEVARRLKITRERVRQIHDSAVTKLRREIRRKMAENGVTQ